MANGGVSPEHAITVNQGSGADMVATAQGMGGPGDAGNGFKTTDDMGSVSLSGYPNLKAGDYMWTVHASDEMAQPTMVSVAWKFRVLPEVYDGPATHAAEPEGDGVTDDPEVEDTVGNQDQWGSYISSAFMPSPFDGNEANTNNQTDVDTDTVAGGQQNAGGMIPSLDLASTASTTISGRIDGDADVDVLWVAGLTPNSVLDVKIVGTSETGIGSFNTVAVNVYQHMPGEEIAPADRAAVMPGASAKAAFDHVYKDLACGFYYLEVTGTAGGYTLTWDFDTTK